MRVRMFLRKFIKSSFCFISAVAIIINAGVLIPVHAEVKLPTGRSEEFSQNDIVFYDPEGNVKESKNKSTCSVSGGGGNCTFIGDTKDERLWSGLRGYGFTPEQTAALMGNFSHEGGSPTRQEDSYNNARDRNCRTQEGNAYTVWTGPNEHHSSCIGGPYSAGSDVQGIGLSFAQWTYKTRREHYLEVMQNLGLYDTYFDGDAYKEWGRLSDDALRSKVSDTEYTSLWCAALNFVYEEIFEGDYQEFLSKDSVDSMANYVAVRYEGCSGCSSGSAENLARRQSAKDYYQAYLDGQFDAVDPGDSAGSSIGSSSGSSSSSSSKSNSEDGSQVLIIGDSITVRSEDALRELMPEVTIDAEVGRGFPKGVKILEDLDTVPDIIVFALGTNTENIKKEDAEKVLEKAGSSKVIFVTNYSLGEHDYTGNNALFNSLKTDNKNVVVADWAGAVSSDPTKYVADEGGAMDVHPTIPEGTKLFAKTIYQAITNKSSNCGGTSSKGVTTYEYDGNTYAFPIAGATKANVLNGRNNAGASALSPLPCSSYPSCHHDSPAVDTGIRLDPNRAAEYGGTEDNMMYYSTGAQVVALVSGTITSYSSGYNKDSRCASITYQGDDGRHYWIGHTLYDPSIKVGDHFTVGQNMTLIGPPVCANGTQSHVHVNTTAPGGSCTMSNGSGCTNDAIDIINAGFEALPED